MQQAPRPRVTPKILLFVVIDMAGMALFATGILWLVQTQALFVAGFPSSTAEAVAAAAVGLIAMFWSAAQILRELLAPRPGYFQP